MCIRDSSSTIGLRAKNIIYISVLDKYLGEETVDSFLKILQRKNDTEEVGSNLGSIRNIYEQILTKCSERIPSMKEYCLDDYGQIILGGKTIGWLKSEQHINDVRDRLFFSLQKIASKYGSHRNLMGDTPTIEAINAIIYQLKDMIVWFDDICKEYPK